MVRKTSVLVIGVLMLLASTAVAQGRMGRGWGMRGPGFCVNGPVDLDIANKAVFEGIVTSVDIERGRGYPTFTLNENITIVASPFWQFMQSGFEIAKGQQLRVAAFPCLSKANTYVAAEVTDIRSNQTIKLRTDNGVPVGMRGRRAWR